MRRYCIANYKWRPINFNCRTLIEEDFAVDVGRPVVGPWWRHTVGHVDDDVTAQAVSQLLDHLIATRPDLDVNLVRVLVGARLARQDVLHTGAAVLTQSDGNVLREVDIHREFMFD